jgi:hypothetical protein
MVKLARPDSLHEFSLPDDLRNEPREHKSLAGLSFE